jgi:hypothetical protein
MNTNTLVKGLIRIIRLLANVANLARALNLQMLQLDPRLATHPGTVYRRKKFMLQYPAFKDNRVEFGKRGSGATVAIGQHCTPQPTRPPVLGVGAGARTPSSGSCRACPGWFQAQSRREQSCLGRRMKDPLPTVHKCGDLGCL